MSTETPPQFDASQEVPDAYDIFCEACGYSLAGLTTDRCPECGSVFEPKELPFARIPWLHRRRLGKFNAYWKTVAMVCFEPRKFATEICRPVRISATDARRFRLKTIWLATIAFSLLPIAMAGLSIFQFFLFARTRPGISIFPSSRHHGSCSQSP